MLTSKDANEIINTAQKKFINENINFIIATINARITKEASGSKMYRVNRASIELSGKLMIVHGALEIPLKKHYNDSGFVFEITQRPMDDYPILLMEW